MKAVKLFSLVALLAVVLASCNNFEKILPKKDGTWKVTTQTQRDYSNDSLVSTETQTNAGTFMFESDGTGTLTDMDSTYAITWTADTDNDMLTICQDFLGLQFCIPYMVDESSKDKMELSATLDAGPDRSEVEATLERE